ncbi:dTDP-4-dehydrorhamnose 3,5-epimerase, partial [Methylobacterium sp. Leaf465]|uniref:dTDP-4-dehydrorhamnose 3,5-epimerase n=1 Tax=Methylobacterium sp. Leaf465 TaxID=1736385 RepID=UPI0006F3DAB1
ACAEDFAARGLIGAFAQSSISYTAPRGTVRGLHFQRPPMAQAKLIRVLAGAILDVAVDLRRASPTYGRHVAVRLDAQAGEQLYIPVGFGHGFCTLEPDTMVAYKVAGGVYSPEHDGGLLWNDPALGIAWPVSEAEAQLSAKDRIAPRLADLPPLF